MTNHNAPSTELTKKTFGERFRDLAKSRLFKGIAVAAGLAVVSGVAAGCASGEKAHADKPAATTSQESGASTVESNDLHNANDALPSLSNLQAIDNRQKELRISDTSTYEEAAEKFINDLNRWQNAGDTPDEVVAARKTDEYLTNFGKDTAEKAETVYAPAIFGQDYAQKDEVSFYVDTLTTNKEVLSRLYGSTLTDPRFSTTLNTPSGNGEAIHLDFTYASSELISSTEDSMVVKIVNHISSNEDKTNIKQGSIPSGVGTMNVVFTKNPEYNSFEVTSIQPYDDAN